MTETGVVWRRRLRAAVVLMAVALVVRPNLARGQARDSLAIDTTVVRQDEGSSLIPLPVIFYQPETGVGFGASGVYLFQLGGPADSAEHRLPSVVSAIGIYTTKSQIIAAVQTDLYPASGRYRYIGELSYSKFPTKLWGIGNDTPDELEEDYTPVSFNLMLEAQRRLRRGWYAGITAQFAYRELKEVTEDGLLEGGLIPGSEDGRIVGAGLLLMRDTRESTWFPRSSSFHQIRGMLYDDVIGSDYDYFSLTVDLRKYTPVFGGHVVALRALGQGISAAVGMAIPPARAGVEPAPIYFLFEDDFCHGHGEQAGWTVKQWRRDQRVDDQDELEAGFRDIVSHPWFIGGRKLDPRRTEMFFTASYDLDKFRSFVFDSTFLERFVLEPDLVEQIRVDDIALLRFTFRWLRFALFAEPTMTLKEEAKPSQGKP